MRWLGLALAVVDQVDGGVALVELADGELVVVDCLGPRHEEGDRLLYRPGGADCPLHKSTRWRHRQHTKETA